MKMNTEMLEKLASLPDRELWEAIVAMTSAKGIRLRGGQPSHEDLNRLREAFRKGGGMMSLGEATRFINEYKQKYTR